MMEDEDEELEPEPEAPGKPKRLPVPKTKEEFPAWLLAQKQKWREMRDDPTTRRRGDLLGHFRGAAARVSRRDWQILHIAERDRSPGVFTLWAVVGGNELQAVPLRVPRTLYINSYVPDLELEKLEFVTKVN